MNNEHADLSKTKPTVMQVIPELGQGGAEQGCIDVAVALMDFGAGSIVVSNGGFRIPEFYRCGVTHINMPVHSKNPLVMARNIYRLRKLIKKHNVNIVHARSRAPAWSCLKACEGTNARFMTTCHAPYNINGKLKNFYNSSISRGERVIAISRYVGDYLRNNYPINERKIRIIPRGIALEKFHPAQVTPERMIKTAKEWRVPDDCNVILLPGRLTRWKGHKVMIDAVSMLDRSDIFCVFLGSDQGRTEYRKEIDSYIKEKGLERMIRIIDNCSDMPAAYMLAAAVISASIDPEGFGRVPVEGQAMGRPVIATDHGGATETIINGETGWLVPPSNAYALAKAMSEALSLDSLQRSVLATKAMSHIADKFTKEIMTRKTLDVYGELL